MHSVRIELAKLILVGTRITYQATGDAGSYTYTPEYKLIFGTLDVSLECSAFRTQYVWHCLAYLPHTWYLVRT